MKNQRSIGNAGSGCQTASSMVWRLTDEKGPHVHSAASLMDKGGCPSLRQEPLWEHLVGPRCKPRHLLREEAPGSPVRKPARPSLSSQGSLMGWVLLPARECSSFTTQHIHLGREFDSQALCPCARAISEALGHHCPFMSSPWGREGWSPCSSLFLSPRSSHLYQSTPPFPLPPVSCGHISLRNHLLSN